MKLVLCIVWYIIRYLRWRSTSRASFLGSGSVRSTLRSATATERKMRGLTVRSGITSILNLVSDLNAHWSSWEEVEGQTECWGRQQLSGLPRLHTERWRREIQAAWWRNPCQKPRVRSCATRIVRKYFNKCHQDLQSCSWPQITRWKKSGMNDSGIKLVGPRLARFWCSTKIWNHSLKKWIKRQEPNTSHCPPALLGQRQLKLNFILPEQSVQSLIFHMGKPIKRHLRSLYSYSLIEILLGNKLPPGLSPSSKALAAPWSASSQWLCPSNWSSRPHGLGQDKSVPRVQRGHRGFRGWRKLATQCLDLGSHSWRTWSCSGRSPLLDRKDTPPEMCVTKSYPQPRCTCTGLSPKTRCLRIWRQRISAALLGLFSWKRSPPRITRSTPCSKPISNSSANVLI